MIVANLLGLWLQHEVVQSVVSSTLSVAPLPPQAAGVFGGIAAGAALVALIEVLTAGIRRPADLTAKLGITVFSTLPYFKTDREIRNRRLRLISGVLATLGMIAAVLWAVDTYYMPLDLLLDQVLVKFSLMPGPSPVLV